MPDDITRLEQELIRIDTRIDTRLTDMTVRITSLEIAFAKLSGKNDVSVWKFIASSLGGVLLGLVPYILHLQGVIK